MTKMSVYEDAISKLETAHRELLAAQELDAPTISMLADYKELKSLVPDLPVGVAVRVMHAAKSALDRLPVRELYITDLVRAVLENPTPRVVDEARRRSVWFVGSPGNWDFAESIRANESAHDGVWRGRKAFTVDDVVGRLEFRLEVSPRALAVPLQAGEDPATGTRWNDRLDERQRLELVFGLHLASGAVRGAMLRLDDEQLVEDLTETSPTRLVRNLRAQLPDDLRERVEALIRDPPREDPILGARRAYIRDARPLELSGSVERRAYQLLVHLFENDEIQRIFAHDLPRAVHSLPGVSANRQTYAFEAVKVARRRGALRDLLVAVRRLRPAYTASIDEMLEALRASQPEGSRVQTRRS